MTPVNHSLPVEPNPGVISEADQNAFAGNRKVWYTVFCLLIPVILFVAVEVIFRMKGFKPFSLKPVAQKLEPAGQIYKVHPEVGYVHLPGSFQVYLANPFSFRMTYLPDGTRITSQNDSPGAGRPEIWIFGCSITDGWSLNDWETYSWLLQEKFPEYRIVNFGTNGYSTLQSLIRFREALKQGNKPVLAVYAYGALHDRRNAQTRGNKKVNYTFSTSRPPAVSIPYGRVSPDHKLILHNDPFSYRGIPLMRYSALLNALDEKINVILEPTYHGNDVSRLLLQEFGEEAKAHSVGIFIAGVAYDTLTDQTIKFCRDAEIPAESIAVDYLRVRKYNNKPYDPHPSALANREYAEKLAPILRTQLQNQAHSAK